MYTQMMISNLINNTQPTMLKKTQKTTLISDHASKFLHPLLTQYNQLALGQMSDMIAKYNLNELINKCNISSNKPH